VPVAVRTSAPRWLFDLTLTRSVDLATVECDTGVVQIDSLRLDERATIERADAFHATLPERARAEAALLREHDARLVVSDAPALGCAAAAAAGIPAVVCSNFTWDWIYAGYDPNADVVRRIGEAYAKAHTAWRLPIYGGFETFANIVDVPLIARHAQHARDGVRSRLDLPLDKPLALVSFGGYGVRDFNLGALDCLDDVGVVITTGAAETPETVPGVACVDVARIYEMGLRYEDLVAAVDVVVTKPGYGIVSECIANETAMLYTSRGRFVEYDVMVREMPRYLRCRYLPQDDLLAGRWSAALR
jgi:L-arabinokinase